MVKRAYKNLPQREQLKMLVTTVPRQIQKGRHQISKNHMRKAKRIAALAGAPAPVFKQPGKAKKDKYIHPKGRLAKQLRRAAVKQLVKGEKETNRFIQTTQRSEIYVWFANELKNHVDPHYVCREKQFLADWVFRYIQRNDEELERLSRRRGDTVKVRGRERTMATQRAIEFKQYSEGMLIPNIMLRKVCHFLRNWDGNADQLRLVEMMRVVSPLGTKRPKPRVLPPMKRRSRRARREEMERVVKEYKEENRRTHQQKNVKHFDTPGTKEQLAKSTELRKKATLGDRAERRAELVAQRRRQPAGPSSAEAQLLTSNSNKRRKNRDSNSGRGGGPAGYDELD